MTKKTTEVKKASEKKATVGIRNTTGAGKNTADKNETTVKKPNGIQFEKGHKKVGGRKKGTPNKMTRDLRKVLEEQLRPHIEKLYDYIDRIHELDKKTTALAQWAPYIMPKLSNITLGDDQMRDLTTEEYLKQLNDSFKAGETKVDVTKIKIIKN